MGVEGGVVGYDREDYFRQFNRYSALEKRQGKDYNPVIQFSDGCCSESGCAICVSVQFRIPIP